MPAPRYLFRIKLVQKLLRTIPKGRFLDIGIGGGDFLLRLSKNGYIGKGIDISRQAINESKERLKNTSGITVEKKNFMDIKNEKFEIIFMFEVLEHIKEDASTLRKINQILPMHGHFFVSVPCHSRKWGATDDWAGHIRRYEKIELKKKLEEAGLKPTVFWCYGFPFINMIKPARDYYAGKRLKETDLSMQEKTEKSGIDRSHVKKYKFFFNYFFLNPFYYLQFPFLNKDMGEGYLVMAEKVKEI